MELAILILKLLALFAVIGVLTYFTIDYLKHKEEVYSGIHDANTNIDSLKSALSKTDKVVKEEKEKNEIQFYNFDSSLKDYFAFNSSPENSKLFYDNKSSIDKNLELKTPLMSSRGIRINTSQNASNTNNLRICDDQDHCVSLSVNSDGFNITPNKLSNMLIKSEDNKKTIAKFDMKNNGIYIGGSDNMSPLYVLNNDVYIQNKSFNTMYSEINSELTNLKTDIDHIQPRVDDLYYITSNFEYDQLKNKPMLFDGDYNKLTNKPSWFNTFDGTHDSLIKPVRMNVTGMLYEFGSVGRLRSNPQTRFRGNGSTNASIRVKGSSMKLRVISSSYYLPDIYIEFDKPYTGTVKLEADDVGGGLNWKVVGEKTIKDADAVMFNGVYVGKIENPQ